MKQNKVIITGSSSGIGLASVKLFLRHGYQVYGLDLNPSKITDENYNHYQISVSDLKLPEIKDVHVIVNNAGTMEPNDVFETNVLGYLNVIETYQGPSLKHVINVASTAGHIGFGNVAHAMSQASRLVLTKHYAQVLGTKYKTLVNSISPGAIRTNLEPILYNDKNLMDMVASENILKRWFDPEEVAQWIFFLAHYNTIATGQDIILDGGEMINFNFIEHKK